MPVFATGWKPSESLSAPVVETISMASGVQKITLSSSRDIPLNKLILSKSNVRRVKSGVSIEDLAADIARRGCLLQGLNVRPVLDADCAETGMLEVPAGGRRVSGPCSRSSSRSASPSRFGSTCDVGHVSASPVAVE